MIESEVIDARVGDVHVTPEQIADVNQGTYGPDDYVLSTGRQLEAQVVTNNSVRVFDGVMVYCGIRDNIPVNQYYDISIDNGMQGTNRNDIIVRRYVKKEGTNRAKAVFAVAKGEPVEGAAVDPEIEKTDLRAGALSHDMLLHRVKIEGLNIVAVEPLYDILYNADEIKRMLGELNSKLYTLNYNNKKDILTATGATFTVPYNGVIRYMNRASTAGAFFEYLIGGSGTAISNHIYGADSYLSGEFTVCEGDTITCRYISIKSSKTTFIPWVL